MPRISRNPIFPLIGVVAALFALSPFAPKAWESLQSRPLQRMRGTRVVAAVVEAPLATKKRQATPITDVGIRRQPDQSQAVIEEPQFGPEAAPPMPPFDVEAQSTKSPPPPIADEPPAGLETPAPTATAERPLQKWESASPPAIVSISDDEQPRELAVWPAPGSLLTQLRELLEIPATAAWAQATLTRIEELSALHSHADGRAPELFDDLRKLVGEAAHLAHKLDPLGVRVKLKRAEYALARRVEVWDQVYLVAARSKSASYPAIVEPRRLAESLRSIELLMRGRTGAEDWRKYLLLDKAWKLTKSGGLSEVESRDISRQILGRMESHVLNDTQLAFFRRPEFKSLATELRLFAYEPVDTIKLLADLEGYESARRREPALRVADAYQSLRWSPDVEIAALADTLDTHYRNANLRIAVSGQLINRLLPEVKPTAEGVSDHIAGAKVHGRSETEARLMIRLIPDRLRIRLGLEAHGVVASETAASKGPATIYNDDLSRYSARKQMIVDRRGLKVMRAETEAESESYIRGLETEFDGLPILGPIVRSIAQQKYYESLGQAKSEVESRVADRASSRLDDEVHKKLADAERQFEKRVLDPLNKLKLQPTALGMETTAERMIIRYRLVADHQLAAHTPRPQAPGDSWLSLQIHQSSLNNALEQMNFDGRQTNVRDLLVDLAQTLGQPQPKIPDDLPDDVMLKFADYDAVRIHCETGKVWLIFKLAELNAGKGSRWRNFEVRAPLEPQIDGLDARLARDDTIELSGERLGLRDQIALRGIFSRVISKNKTISLIPEKLRTDPRLKDLAVHQFIVDDGWISLALSPQRPVAKQAQRQPSSRKTK